MDVIYRMSCRKVKYLNMRGSLVDEHTVKGVTKAGKEVCCHHSLTDNLPPCSHGVICSKLKVYDFEFFDTF